MDSIKILMIIDVAPWDLKECCLVGYQLMTKYGYKVIFSTTKNEKSEMMRHRPHVLVLNHLQYGRFKDVVEFARDMGVKICLMSREGIPVFDEIILSLYGESYLLDDVDLFLSWSESVSRHIQNQLSQAEVRTVGCARFDTYHPHYRSLFRTREEFFNHHHFNPSYPLIVWGSAWALFKGEVEKVRERYQNLSELGEKSWSPERIISQRLSFETLRDFMVKFLSKKFLVNIVYHPHPLEDPAVMTDFIKDNPSVKIMKPFDPLEEALFYSQLYVGFPCPAALESWVQNPSRPSVFVRHPDLRVILNFQKELMECAYTAGRYDDFEKKVLRCLQPDYSAAEETIQNRKKLIEHYLFKTDGFSAGRCADMIAELVQRKNPRPRRRFKHAFYGMRLVRSRLRTGHWISLKRPPTHQKYLAPEKVEEWIFRAGQVHQNKISKKSYQVDV